VRGSVVLQRLYDKNRSNDGAGDFEETMVVDPESAPLLAQATAKGHRIGAADEFNFDYGLECILDHAEHLIETSKRKPAPKPAKK
jgi:hypothetical protein